MRIYSIIGLSLCIASTVAFAEDSDKKPLLTIQALNSPVKESLAKFQIALPTGMKVTKATYHFEEVKKHEFDKKGVANKPEFKLNEKTREINLVETPHGLEAQIPASELPPGTYQVLMEVRASKTLKEKFKGLFQNHGENEELKGKVNFVIDASLEVPDPGGAGMATLAGIDSDGDGVRDDVQRWIAENYGSSPNQKAGLRQSAKAFQLVLLTTGDKAASVQSVKAALNAKGCVNFVMSGFDNALQAQRVLKEKMLNTRERTLANFKASENFSGQTHIAPKRGQEGTRCNFTLIP